MGFCGSFLVFRAELFHFEENAVTKTDIADSCSVTSIKCIEALLKLLLFFVLPYYLIHATLQE